jgi:hypothetical protein
MLAFVSVATYLLAHSRKPLLVPIDPIVGAINQPVIWKINRVVISRDGCQWELPCFSEQEKTRALNHLSA